MLADGNNSSFIDFKHIQEYKFNTLKVHDVYRRHPHHAQVMAPSILPLLVNAKKTTKVIKMRIEWVEAVDKMHTYNNFTHNNIGTRRHGTSGSFCAVIEHDVNRRQFNLCKVA